MPELFIAQRDMLSPKKHPFYDHSEVQLFLAYEGDSQVVWFEGNFEEYEKDKRRRLGDEAVQPHRVRYKKLA